MLKAFCRETDLITVVIYLYDIYDGIYLPQAAAAWCAVWYGGADVIRGIGSPTDRTHKRARRPRPGRASSTSII